MTTPPKTLTTGEAAKYCGVNFRTVIRWIERGKLNAFKLPGRGDNRIPIDSFLQFLTENNMPIPRELQSLTVADVNNRVLVIDDQIEMANAIKRILKREKYDVMVAENGFSAGAKLITFKPALITLDLLMPGLDGFDVLSYIANNAELSHVKILVISGEVEEKLNRAKRLGADEALAKPFDTAELIRLVHLLLD